MSVEPVSGLVSVGAGRGLSRQDTAFMEGSACVGGDVGLYGLEVDGMNCLTGERFGSIIGVWE